MSKLLSSQLYNIFMKKIIIEGIRDFINGIKNYPIWTALAIQDIKSRYRRSFLGPFWITINMAIVILTMGPIYSLILKQNSDDYIVNLTMGFIFWGFISNSIIESCNSFRSMDNIIKQISMPFSIYLFKNVYRNLIVFVHNSIIIIPIFFLYSDQFIITINTLLFIPIIILVILNLLWMTTLLAIICTRYADVTQLVGSVMQTIFFLTPIIWTKDLLINYPWILKINIFYHMIESLKLSLLGWPIDTVSISILLISLSVGAIFSLYIFSRFKKSISFWV